MVRLKRALKKAAAVTAIAGSGVIGGTAFVAVPAQAAVEDGSCGGTELCIWRNSGGSGNQLFDTRRSIPHYGGHNYINSGYGLGDSASYYSNRTEWTLGAWKDGSCSGTRARMDSGYDYNLSGTWANDVLSSHASYYNGC